MRIVLFVTDQMLCDGLLALLSQDPTVEVVAGTEESPGGLEQIRQWQPDLVLADVSSWTSGHLDVIRQIAREMPEVNIIALSTFAHRPLVAEAFRSGVRGYVLRQNGYEELSHAIRTVMSGSTYLCSRASQEILDFCTTPQAASGKMAESVLTDRECVVLQMLAEGRSSKEIALALEVSSKTIDACRRQIMRKLGVDSIAGLVKQALLLGLTTLQT